MAQDPTSMKYTWSIKEFSSLRRQIEESAQVTQSKSEISLCRRDKLYSDDFYIGTCKWRLMISTGMSIYLEVADFETLPHGWRKDSRFKLVVVNQLDESLSITIERKHIFSATSRQHVWKRLLKKSHLDASSGFFSGFFLNDSLIIQIEFVACTDLSNSTLNIKQAETLNTQRLSEDGAIEVKKEVIEEGTTSKKARLRENPKENCQKDTEDLIVNFHGFKVRASQQEVLKRMLEKYPDLVSNFQFQNHRLLPTFMGELLEIIDILRRPPHLISYDDFQSTSASLSDLKKAGLTVEWLDSKWEEVSRKKLKIDGTRSAELRKELEEMKLKLEEMMKNIKNAEALLAEEEAETEAARFPLSIDDII